MLKRLLCLMMAVFLLISFAGCGEKTEINSGKQENEQQQAEVAVSGERLSLLFCSSDTLNPYTAATEINRQLCRLIFDPLVKTDNEFNAELRLAQSVSVEKKLCTVKLREAFFSDGSPVSARDVVYSFELAKQSKSSYGYKLYNIKSAQAASEKTVKFSLSKSDPYCENILDFPIIKAGSDKRTDSDGVVLPTIGCGRYTAAEDYSVLELNNKYYGKKGNIKKIDLQVAPDAESISHYIEIGAADMYYTDISDGNIIRMSADKYSINLNNLVYIGINSSYGLLSNTSLRYAISSALDRTAICSNSYYNNALPATGFFNPVWSETSSVQNIQTEANQKITVENLAEMGYNRKDREGFYVNSSGNRINLTLLVNSDNSMRLGAAKRIASQLESAGIKITVVERKYSDYIKLLTSGKFQLYLGEINITPNMDLTELVSPNSSAVFGLPNAKKEKTEDQEKNTSSEAEENSEENQVEVQNKSLEIINGFYKGANTINDVATTLQTEMPLIPVCYRTGVLFCDESIKNVEEASLSDIYFSIESYVIEEK